MVMAERDKKSAAQLVRELVALGLQVRARDRHDDEGLVGLGHLGLKDPETSLPGMMSTSTRSMNETVVIDTSGYLSLLDEADSRHEDALRVAATMRERGCEAIMLYEVLLKA